MTKLLTSKNELKILLTESTEDVFEKLRFIIPADSRLFDEFIMVLSRHKDLKRSQNIGVLSPIEHNIELNKIRGSILHLINNIETLEYNSEVEQNIQFDGDKNSDDWEDFGLFELEEMMSDSMKELEQNLNRLTAYTTELGSKTKEDTAKIVTYRNSNPSPNKQILKRLYDNAAANLNDYGEGLKVEAPIFERYSKYSTSIALTYISKLYETGINLKNEEIDIFYKNIKDLLYIAKDSRFKLDGLYESIKKLPDLTNDLLKAKNKVLKLTETFFESYDNYLNDLDKIIISIENTLFEME